MKKNLKVKDEDFARMKKVYKSNKYVDREYHFYLSYRLRVFLMFFSILLIAVVAAECFDSSFSKEENVVLNYEEKANIDYNVTLLEGNLFEQGTLQPGNAYISELVDNISTDFNYEFKVDSESDIEYTYYVEAMMEYKSNKEGTIISQQVDTLIKETTQEINNSKDLILNQNVNLDYDYYNKLAKEINEKYVDINGNLYLKMHISVNVKNEAFENVIRQKDVIEVKIPLLSTEVSASMINSIDNKDVYIEHKEADLNNGLTLFIGISLLILDTIFLLMTLSFVVKTTPKKSKYMKLRDGLLRDYDRVIVNTKSIPEIEGHTIIDCYGFNELLDAQKLLNKPIIYNEIVKNQKCIFIIVSDNEVYRFVLKECDIDF